MCSITQLCPTLCNPMDCSPPGASVHGILQARKIEYYISLKVIVANFTNKTHRFRKSQVFQDRSNKNNMRLVLESFQIPFLSFNLTLRVNSLVSLLPFFVWSHWASRFWATDLTGWGERFRTRVLTPWFQIYDLFTCLSWNGGIKVTF